MKSFILAMFMVINCFGFTTKLFIPNDPSDQKINKAISVLYKAKKTRSFERRSSYLSAARAMLAKTKRAISFEAEVFVDNAKQFESDDYVDFWDFKKVCFKGNPNEAAKLINMALKMGYWDSDEEWIESASVNSKNLIELTIIDGPNETHWKNTITTCK